MRLRRKTYLFTSFLIFAWSVMPILGLQHSSVNISSEGTVKYPEHELGLWDVRCLAAVPEEASWIVVNSADYGKTNLLENPDFELDFLAWSLYIPPDKTPLSISLPSGYMGRSLLLTNNKLGYRGGAFQYFSNVPPNTTFHFKAMVKTVNVEGLETTILYRDVEDAEGNWYGGELERISGSSDWTLYETSFTTPNVVTRVAVFPVLVYNRGEVWIDEASLTMEGWQPPTVPVILNWYTLRLSLPIRTEQALTNLEEGLISISTENFWGIISPGYEEVYRIHIAFDDDLDTMWFGENLLGYPLYLAEKPDATKDEWMDEMYLRMIRGFYNYFSPLTKVGITWGWTDAANWNTIYGEPAITFIQQHYEFLFFYPYTIDLEDWLKRNKPYLSAVEQLFPNQKKFWILTRIWPGNEARWEREAIALEMKSCLDRNMVITTYHESNPSLEETWALMLKSIELYDSKASYYETLIYGRNLLTGYMGDTYGWVEVFE